MKQVGTDATSSSTSASLIRRVKANDPVAWQHLCTVYGPLVYRWCRQADVRVDDTPDVVQEVFHAAAQGIRRFQHDPERGGFRAWLRTITAHRVSDYFRAFRQNPHPVGGTAHEALLQHLPEPLPSDDVGSRQLEQVQVLHAALRVIEHDFQETTWTAFWRTVVEQHATDEVARDLGMKPKAVRQARHRVMQRLREAFGELID